jgi:hypothetical protein
MVRVEFGRWVEPFDQPLVGGPRPDLTGVYDPIVLCEAETRISPRVLIFRTAAGYAAGLWWLKPGGVQIGETIQPMPLRIWAESPDPNDLTMLLALVRSARWNEQEVVH